MMILQLYSGPAKDAFEDFKVEYFNRPETLPDAKPKETGGLK